MTVLHVGDPEKNVDNSTEEFLNLSWHGDESADEIIDTIRNSRNNSQPL